MKASNREKVVLGIDPGTRMMGYGVLVAKGSSMRVLQLGVINLHKFEDHLLRLHKVFNRVLSLIDEVHPDEVAFEAPFYGKNVQSMLKLGRVQGVAMAAALHRKIPVFEYAPRKVKQAVTGHGNASKEQVAKMLVQQFKIGTAPKFMDATDALAVALCHYAQRGLARAKAKTWNAFVKENPNRVKKEPNR